MKAVIVFFAVLALAAAQTIGIAKIKGTSNDPTIFGFVTFATVNSTHTMMNVNITGITVGTGIQHGIHVHQYGDISNAAGTSAGSHWNPYNNTHGCPPSAIRHLGDTGNWDVGVDGSIVGSKTLDLITLTGTNSLIGFAVIVHAATDNCTDTLSSAARLGHGIIGVANPGSYGNYTQNGALPPPTAPNGVLSAICVLEAAAAGGISGWIRFDQATPASSTTVTAMIMGLVSGTSHGFHIHQWGDITLSSGASAGPHYTGPVYDVNQAHSIPGSGYSGHVGDMGNIFYYDVNGVAYYNNVISTFGLWGSANPVVGRAVIVHELVDNCAQPYGAAGTRYAQCVIGAANPATLTNATIPAGVPTTQDSALCVAYTTGSVALTSGFVASENSSFAAVVVPSFLMLIFAYFF